MLSIPHYQNLAKVLVEFSTNVQPGENVLIDAFDIPEEMVIALIEAVKARAGIPFYQIHNERLRRAWLLNSTAEGFEVFGALELERMKKMQAYIALRGSNNIFENTDVPADVMKVYMKAIKTTLDYRVKKTKWVVLRWPTPSMAQQASMSTAAFSEFFFKVCTLDYTKMIPGMAALKALMERTDRVHIKSPGTDLRFSIKGIPAIVCGGNLNIPDGEVFTAPVRDSVEGVVSYNAPTVYQGSAFDNVVLRFEKGKIVEASSSDTKKLNEILDQDSGARYIGEFAIGFNPYVLEPMRDILFDEKIAGSFHFTPGEAYEEADNGNRSQVHWDLVCIQRPEYGGGEIYFDDVLIRKDGRFVLPELFALNPENLV
jgi:aminopeptidase